MVQSKWSGSFQNQDLPGLIKSICSKNIPGAYCQVVLNAQNEFSRETWKLNFEEKCNFLKILFRGFAIASADVGKEQPFYFRPN